jgi:phage terminase Nu1 subunit (DNA packaging protein)
MLPEKISAADLSDLLDVDERTVRNLVARRVITRAGRGKFDTKSTIRALLADAKRNADRDLEAAERARLNAARRRVAEARLAEIEARTMEVAEVEAIVDKFVAVTRTEFDSMAGRVAGLDWSLRKKIDEERFKSLTRLSDHFAKVASEIEKRNRKNTRSSNDD